MMLLLSLSLRAASLLKGEPERSALGEVASEVRRLGRPPILRKPVHGKAPGGAQQRAPT
jgi:hypothetical protein